MVSNGFDVRGKSFLFASALAFCVLAGAALFLVFPSVAKAPVKVTTLLASSETIIGERLAYPIGAPAKVTAVIIALLPGEETGWHRHDAPLFGYVLEGELTVDYGEKGKHVYRAGDAVLEAIDTSHNGRNTGEGLMRILAVYMGTDGAPMSVSADGPHPQR